MAGWVKTSTSPTAVTAPPAETPLAVIDFDGGQLPAGWTTTGTAFGNQPTASNRGWAGQSGLAKQGEYFIGTWEDGNGDGLAGVVFPTSATRMRPAA